MSDLNITNEDKVRFNIETSETILNKIHTYFKNEPKLKPLKIEKSDDNMDEQNIIHKFKIESLNKPIYEKISCFDDIKLVIDDIRGNINSLFENIIPILNDKDCDDNTKKALKAIGNSIKNFNKNISRLDRGTDIELDLSQNKEKFIDNLSSLLKDRIIKDCIQPIYQGMKYSDNYIYEKLLICINKWLQEMGIYTFEINESDKINDINLNYIETITPEITKDYSKNELIKDIVQYPYVFSEEVIVCEGEVVSWRFE